MNQALTPGFDRHSFLKTSSAGIGDINSQAKGSGARYNQGKPDLALLPLDLLAAWHAPTPQTQEARAALRALRDLANFQDSHDIADLAGALHELGDGWEDCANVFSYGKRKYAAWNWAKGMPWSVPLACAARHLVAMIKSETTDLESGFPHRGHAYCNIVMLATYASTYREGNDLPAMGLLTGSTQPPAAEPLKLPDFTDSARAELDAMVAGFWPGVMARRDEIQAARGDFEIRKNGGDFTVVTP